MIYLRNIHLLGAVCMLGLFISGTIPAQEETAAGHEYFTSVNLWREKGKEIFSTNYHVGEIIPVGTPVRILKNESGRIEFSTDTDKKCTIVHVTRHSRIGFDALFNRLFTKADVLAPGGLFHKLTMKEKKAVADGTIIPGMSRKAVIMAFGYPPSHKTPDLEGGTWIYWLSRWRTVTVVFNESDSVQSVKGLPEKASRTEGKKQK